MKRVHTSKKIKSSRVDKKSEPVDDDIFTDDADLLSVKNKRKPKSFLIIGSKLFKRSTINELISESKNYFETVLFVTVDKVQLQTVDEQVGLYYKGKNLLDFDVIYPRISSRDYSIGEAVMKAIESSSAYCPVSLRGYQVSNHKYHTSQLLHNAGMPSVATALSISPKYAEQSIDEIKFPMVLKLISGFAGKGVMLVNDSKQLVSLLDTVHMFEQVICMQEFIKGKNSDIRCYVTGNKVIAVKRTGRRGDWRANISRGGYAELVEVTPEMKRIALTSSRLLGMDICSVDLMQTSNGFVIIEVNFMPGPFIKFLGTLIIKEWARFIFNKASESSE